MAPPPTFSKCITPEHRRQDGAGDDAEQHGDIGDEAGAPLDQAEDHQQHEQRDAEPVQAAP